METPPKKLLDQVRDALRLKHYSYQTEKTYVQWIRRYILFHNKRHPRDMGVLEIETFLTHLAVKENVSASTQNQAFSALLFLYRHVLQLPLDDRIDALRARPSRYLPTVLTPEEALLVIQQIPGTYQLLAQLLYGSGLRLREALSLRIKDIDFSQHQLNIRDAKGRESRYTMLPNTLIPTLQTHLHQVKQLHIQDLDLGYGQTSLPHAFHRHQPPSLEEFCRR
ncbi:MAG: tyrosine-type recombinase/integrase [Alkalinema sp. RU_4_3]|nr:tyrosine-type recombinase/integrase [Alkalinema sp. RU_4_3]